MMLRRIVRFLVHADHERGILPVGGRADDDFFGAGIDVRLGFGGVGEEPGGLDDDLDAQRFPRQLLSDLSMQVMPISVPSRTMELSFTVTEPGNTPKLLSYLNKCPSVFASVRSLTLTISIALPYSSISRLVTWRPIRPKPLIPTFTAMGQTSSRNITSHTPLRRKWCGRGAERAEKSGLWDNSQTRHTIEDNVARVQASSPMGEPPCVPGPFSLR